MIKNKLGGATHVGVGVTNVLSRRAGTLPLQGVKNIQHSCDSPYDEAAVKWEDPEDLVGANGRVLEKWGKTILVQKQGSAPTHPRDGKVVGYTIQRNQHRENPLNFYPSMNPGERHYFQFFVYNSRGRWNKPESASFELFFRRAETYSFDITFFDDPAKTPVVETRTGGKSGNELDTSHIFREIKPCVFKNGQVQYFLKWENFREKENGGAANLTGADGDVMIRFPKIKTFEHFTPESLYLKMMEEGEPTYGMSGWGDYPSTLSNSYMYIGAFPGRIENGKLRSAADGRLRSTGSLEQLKSAARANGQGYNILPLPALVYLRWLYIMRYGNLASKKTLGQKSGLENSAGETVDFAGSGMDYKGGGAMRFLGLENINHALGEWVNGLKMGPNQKILYSEDLDFNDPSSFRVDNEGRFTPLSFTSPYTVLGLPGGPELFIRKGVSPGSNNLDQQKLSFNEGNIVYGGDPKTGFLGVRHNVNWSGARLFYA